MILDHEQNWRRQTEYMTLKKRSCGARRLLTPKQNRGKTDEPSGQYQGRDLAQMKTDRLAHSERAVKAVEALKALGFTEEGETA
jgi:hypothetical protein